ncbi:MAG: malto-oligosyltrehalose trehalohydrolase [Fibrobacteres bacterium]|nr:malto-oligosyltrehalose trehalohydrolase [Fibrobacterota bacterium]
MALGANYIGDGKCRFEVWAPDLDRVILRLRTGLEVPLRKDGDGIHSVLMQGISPGTDYDFLLPDGTSAPDPASRWQPEGVTGPSRVVDHEAFFWRDRDWQAPPLGDFLFYEIHTGTFSPEGTFEGIIRRIPYLKDLGITALEIMPVAQFPGDRNWGYDGVFPFAVQNSYGGPDGLMRLVDACHRAGLAVALDVVYNHFGPEGNVHSRFGPVLTDRYQTAWGQAINFDGPGSDGVRELFLENALYWFRHFHVDALRLDAVHAYMDQGCRHILQEMSQRAEDLSKEVGRAVYLIGESDLNDVKLIQPRDRGGWGLDAVWGDDFHHSLHALLTGERSGYYGDFGTTASLAKAFREPHVYDGTYSPVRGRHFGNSARGFDGSRFVVCAQNHDQVGNRKLGERLATLAPKPALKLAALSVILSPYLPLLFMGEEFGETHPFLYFANHSDPPLLEAVREGRKAEFSHFGWTEAPPDPFDIETFRQCRLDWGKPKKDGHREVLAFYKFLIRLRKEHPALQNRDPQAVEVHFDEARRFLSWERSGGGRRLKCLMNLSPEVIPLDDEDLSGEWMVLSHSRSGSPERADSGMERAGFADRGREDGRAREGWNGDASPAGEWLSASPEMDVEIAEIDAESLEPWGFLLLEEPEAGAGS